MTESSLALILERCIAEIELGERPDSVAARYPSTGSDLAEMLRLASQLRATRDAYIAPTDFLRTLGEHLRTPSA